MLTRTCLIVDDSSLVRRLAKHILMALDFEVEEAENGQVALERCALSMPSAILLDWNMPVLDGIQFLRTLRDMEGGDQPKVIFCTTESDVDHVREAFEAGTNEYLMKPFDKEMLKALLGSIDSPTTCSTL